MRKINEFFRYPDYDVAMTSVDFCIKLSRRHVLFIKPDKIISLSTAHLHPETIALIEKCHGNLPAGPSIAIRQEGFLVNSHLGDSDCIEMDMARVNGKSLFGMAPDLVLLRAVARGQEAAWLNIDRDAPIYSDFLPVYDEDSLIMPQEESWAEGLSDTMQTALGNTYVVPSREALRLIESGKSPTDDLDAEEDGLVF